MKPPAGRPYALIFPLFALSGFCGLIYESIWASYLKLFLGHAAYAQTVVLVVFIGGMAIGAALCGRYANRLRNPLLLYAAAEFVVGWCAIAFHTVFVGATDWGYATLLPATCSAEGWCVSSWILAALLILPQSVLLGTTFPLMAAGALRLFRDDPGRRIALLYFLNSLGAVFGVLISAFVLIPAVGLPGTSMIAGILNVLLAIAVYTLIDPRATAAVAPVVMERTSAMAPRLLLAVAMLTGLSSFIYEIVWIRMLSLVLGASTQSFELMLASFILGLALGGAWIRSRIDRLRDAAGFLAGVQVAMGVLALLTLAFYDATFEAMAWMLRALSSNDNGWLLFNVGSALIASAVMLPATFCAGMTLPLITLLLFRNGAGESSLGRVYAWNTLGSILGVIVAVHVALPLAGIRGSLVAGAAIDILLGIWIYFRASSTVPWVRWSATVAGVAAALIVPFQFDIDPVRKASGVFRYARAALPPTDKVLFDRDGKTSSVAIIDKEGIVSITTNGKPDASIRMRGSGAPVADEDTMLLAAVLPIAYKPDIAKAAVIGFGSGMSTATLLGSPRIERVDTIEIEPVMVDAARAFRPVVERAYADPRSRIVIDDAKSYFARSREKYDLVLSEPSNPWVSGVASLYTAEFYARVRSSLRPGGLFVQWVQFYEFDQRLLASIVNSLNTSFDDYVVYYTSGDLLFVAKADGQLPAPSSEVFTLPGIREDAARLGFRNLADIELRRLVRRGMLSSLLFYEAVPANSDYEPYLDSNAPRARFRHGVAPVLTWLKGGPVPMVDYFDPRPWPVDWFSTPADPSSPGIGYQSAQTVKVLRKELAGVPSLPASAPPAGQLLPAAHFAALRMAFVDCVPPSTTQALWPQIRDAAAWINGALWPVQLDPFWKDVEQSRCATAMSERQRQWIGLFRAIGNRDAGATQSRAQALLEDGPQSDEEIEYLLIAGLTGAISRGDSSSAQAMLAKWMPGLPQKVRDGPSFLVLRRMSGLVAPIGTEPPPSPAVARTTSENGS